MDSPWRADRAATVRHGAVGANQRGFTLLEILIAVTILGILLTTVYGAVSRTLESKKIAEEHAELYATGRESVLKMAGEIEAAVSPRSGDRILFRGTKGGGKPPTDTIEFVMMNRGSYAGYNSVRPGQVLVVYSLDPLPTNRGYFALRREEYLYSKLLADADGIESNQTSMTEEEDPRPTEMATHLVDCPDIPGQVEIAGNCLRLGGLEFSYYDDFARDWREEWDSTATATLGRLPAAVRIALYMADERGNLHDFSTVVDLPVARGQPTPKPGQTLEDMVRESTDDEGGAGAAAAGGGVAAGAGRDHGSNKRGGLGSALPAFRSDIFDRFRNR